MPAENHEQSPIPEFYAPSLRDEDLVSDIAPVCPAFPEELERIRAERDYKEVAVQVSTVVAFGAFAVFTVITRGLMGISEVVYETVTNQPGTYELFNSVTALRISALVGATASIGFGIHVFNMDMQHYRQKRLEESQTEG